MAAEVGIISVKPQKYGAKNSYVSGQDNFLAESGDLIISNSSSSGAIIFYSFDLKALASLPNIKIKSISVCVSGNLLYSSGSLTVKLVKNFKTSGNSVGTYNDLGDGQKKFDELSLGTFKNSIISDFPNAVANLNDNLSEIIENADSVAFGIRLYGQRAKLSGGYGIVLTLEYEFDGEEPPPEIEDVQLLYGGGLVCAENKVPAGQSVIIRCKLS